MVANIVIQLHSIDVEAFHQTILGLSGTLLGLAFAAFIYVLQDGFRSFKFSRTLFLQIHVSAGKKVLYALSYVVIVCVLRLFFSDNGILFFVIHISFSLVFIKTVLDYRSNLGYLITLNSKKFIPARYGRIRTYLRRIRNAGVASSVTVILEIVLFVVIPIVVGSQESRIYELSAAGEVLSVSLFLGYSVLYLARFIPNFFRISMLEIEMARPTENDATAPKSGSDTDFATEKNLLRGYLESKGYMFEEELQQQAIAEGETVIYLRQEQTPEAWFNILVDEPSGSPQDIRRSIEDFSVSLLQALRKSICDINSFVLSFHISLDHGKRNVFFRLTRSELAELEPYEHDAEEYVRNVSNKLFDDLFRDL